MAAKKRRVRKKRARLPTAPSPTARKIRLPYPKDEAGRPLCRWCRAPVRAPRRSWCSDGCVRAYRELWDSAYQRREVLKRDRGVCALCGTDTLGLARRVMDRKGDRGAQLAVLLASGFREVDLRFRRRGLRPLWEADHIIPVVEGGGGVTFLLLQTLCRPCHRKKTREEAAKRHAAKRDLPDH